MKGMHNMRLIDPRGPHGPLLTEGVVTPLRCVNLPCVMKIDFSFKALIDFSGFCGSENRFF